MAIRISASFLCGVLTAIMIAPQSARASGDVICDAVDGSGASISVGVGRLPILAVLNATASDGGTTWATTPQGDDQAIVFGQGFMDAREARIDFTDPNVNEIVVSLRLMRGAAGKTFAEAGVLEFLGRSVHAVMCEEG